MADSSSSIYLGSATERRPSAFHSRMTEYKASMSRTTDMITTKQEIEVKAEDLCVDGDLDDPTAILGLSSTENVREDITKYVSKDLYGVITSRKTFTHQTEETNFISHGSHLHSPRTHHTHSNNERPVTENQSHFNTYNVGLSPALNKSVQFFGGPAMSTDSTSYIDPGSANHVPISPTGSVIRDSDSSGYSSNSPGAHSVSLSPHPTFGPGSHTPQAYGKYDGNQYTFPSRYQAAALPNGQQLGYYNQVAGTSTAAGSHQMGYYVPYEGEATDSSNASYVSTAPDSKSLPSFHQLQHSRSLLKAEPPGKLQQSFAHPPGCMYNTDPAQMLSHSQGLPHAYQPTVLSTATAKTFDNTCQPHPRTYNSIGIFGDSPSPTFEPLFPQSPLPTFSTIHPQTDISAHNVGHPSNPMFTTSRAKAYSQISSRSVSTNSSSFRLFGNLSSTAARAAPSPCMPSMNGSQVSQVYPGSTMCSEDQNDAEDEDGSHPSQSRVFKLGHKSTCEKCGIKVASSGHLYRHKDSHGANRRFRCTNCDCSFSRHDNLKNHMARAHEIGEVLPSKIKRRRSHEV